MVVAYFFGTPCIYCSSDFFFIYRSYFLLPTVRSLQDPRQEWALASSFHTFPSGRGH